MIDLELSKPLKELYDKSASLLNFTESPFKKIIEWNKERNLNTYYFDNEYKMLQSELSEFKEAVDKHETVDALADIIVVATGSLYKLGYDPEIVMEEVIKEISSRQGNICKSTGKWKKDKNQDPKTLYKANYDIAKLKT